MFLAISSEKWPLVVGIAIAAVAHYALAVFATSRLMKFKSRVFPMPLWHFLIQLLIIVGPVLYLLLHLHVSEPRFDVQQLILQKAEREKAEAAAKAEAEKKEIVSDEKTQFLREDVNVNESGAAKNAPNDGKADGGAE